MPEEKKKTLAGWSAEKEARWQGKLKSMRETPVVANNDEPAAKLEVGDTMEDGTIYAGISPDTNQPMYAAPVDAPMSLDFNAAAEYAEGLKIGGKRDFRVPSKAELNVLFQNREKGALKGTFNLTSSFTTGSYWSSTPDMGSLAWVQRFSDGAQLYSYRFYDSSVRCVR